MYDYQSPELWAGIIIFYIFFLGIYWIFAGVVNHVLLNKKGYRHVGLYILAWLPLINWFTIILTMGLPDCLLHRKFDYLLRQLVASGVIKGGPDGGQPTPGTAPNSVPQNQFASSQPQGSPTSPMGQPAQPVQPSQLFGAPQSAAGGQFTPPGSGGQI